MAKIKFVNKSTGKEYTADSKDVAMLKKNPVLANAYSYEAEEAKPADPKKNTGSEEK